MWTYRHATPPISHGHRLTCMHVCMHDDAKYLIFSFHLILFPSLGGDYDPTPSGDHDICVKAL